jgi:carboxyl-terminal processing protease
MRYRILAASCATLLSVVWFLQGQPAREPRPAAELAKGDVRDKVIAASLAQIIGQVHLTRQKLDETISQRMHRLFVEQWDPRRLIFLEGDIAEFAAATDKHAKLVVDGDLSFPVQVHERFVKRMAERTALAQELAQEKFDFAQEATVILDAKAVKYPKDADEARERLRNQIRYELCSLIVDGVKLDEARTRIQKRHKNLLQAAQRLEKDDLLERYLASLAQAFDPHSGYMSPKTLAEFEIAMRLQLQGIGVALRSDDGKTMVKEILPGGPAADDKRLKPGDQITGVGNGAAGEIVDIVDMPLPRVVQLIRGEAGTKVRLEVIPVNTGQRVVYELTRRQVTLSDKGAKGEIIETTGADPKGPKLRVGVIVVPSFYGGNGTPGTGLTADVARILAGFKQKGVDAVVMDLRFNGGGLLDEAIGTASLLVDDGPIVQVKDFQGNVRQHVDNSPGVAYDGPLVVLVNRLSASASEIFAGVVQDYRRGLVVGDASTFGKGTVAQLVDLSRVVPGNLAAGEAKFGALQVTLQAFYRVSGETTQKRGVVPDVVLPSVTDRPEYSEAKLDHVLDFATIAPAPFTAANALGKEAVKKIQALSAERRARSEEFAKLTQRLARLHELASSTHLTFNETKLKELRAERKELADIALGDAEFDPEPDAKTDRKFGATIYEREVLAIVGDGVRLVGKR